MGQVHGQEPTIASNAWKSYLGASNGQNVTSVSRSYLDNTVKYLYMGLGTRWVTIVQFDFVTFKGQGHTVKFKNTPRRSNG